MTGRRKPQPVREPVQVYLDRQDHATLEDLARAPGWSLDVLIGAIPDGPPDLSVWADDYLYGPESTSTS
jgi:hypothetical protein